jgi:hypothetical protein
MGFIRTGFGRFGAVFIRNLPQAFTKGDFYPHKSSGLSKKPQFFFRYADTARVEH